MEEFGLDAIQLELKYCERCGGLWLRPKGSEVVFCRPCAKAMAGLLRVGPGMPPVGAAQVQSQNLKSTFWSEGGNA